VGTTTETNVHDPLSLKQLDPIWEELFSAEQARILQLLLDKVEVSAQGHEIRLRAEGLDSLIEELRERGQEDERTAA